MKSSSVVRRQSRKKSKLTGIDTLAIFAYILVGQKSKAVDCGQATIDMLKPVEAIFLNL